MRIDLNADLGEGYGPWRMGQDEALMPLISSANIACGYHAGDPLIMRARVTQALSLGVDVGAHVGFPDRQGFGRRVMQIEHDELSAMVIYQLGALDGICRSVGHSMTHMSFHGALGNMAAADPVLARPLLKAVADFNVELLVVSSSSRAIEEAAKDAGLKVATTFLADRAYDDNGLLVSRKIDGSVITDEGVIADRVKRLLECDEVITITGQRLKMPCRSILLHGDTEGALHLAKTIRQMIEATSHQIAPLSRHA
jgi:UPF0271 protein